MPSLQTLAPGLQTTIQDAGRFGFAHLGVSPAGAADQFAFRVGNLLVHNHENTPALEMTLVGGTFQFECDSFIALTGADCAATSDGIAVPCWHSMRVNAGQTLQCRAMKNGARTYLCVHGGFHTTPVMHSYATHVQTRLGGRVLKSGDTLALAPLHEHTPWASRQIAFTLHNYLREKNILRITLGAQADFFSPQAFEQLCSTAYVVSAASNRVGLRLQGVALARAHHEEMITEGVSCGAIQVPSDGQPIILFVEHPTTGGYPKIAHVISADLPRVGQLRPGDEVRFQFVELEAARNLYLQQQAVLRKLAYALSLNAR